MTARRALAALLGVVAAAAAVLSFAALCDLALLCGFSHGLAWLLPVVVDAGAAAGTLVWLSGGSAWRSARRLALTLLGVSIVANALSHGSQAWEDGRAAWVIWVACVVSGLAPAVLGAVIHLAVRYWRAEPPAVVLPSSPIEEDTTPPADTSVEPQSVGLHSVPSPTPPAGEVGDEPGDRVAELVAAGAGWVTVQKETGLSEYHAKKAVREHRNGSGP